MMVDGTRRTHTHTPGTKWGMQHSTEGSSKREFNSMLSCFGKDGFAARLHSAAASSSEGGTRQAREFCWLAAAGCAVGLSEKAKTC